MKDGLFERVGVHENEMARRLKVGLDSMGIPFLVESPSNQQFYIFPNSVLVKLKEDFAWEVISVVDAEHTEIRLVTSWATKYEDIDAFLNALREALHE